MTTRRPISDLACLRAAERALARHLALRPATVDEARGIADTHRETARLIREHATPLTIPPAEHGPDAVAQQHAAGLAVGRRNLEILRMESDAAREDMRAEAWEAASPSVLYARTEAELRARVAYYRTLNAKENAK